VTKPIAYLDQNIISSLYKDPNSELKKEIENKYRVIFSQENLSEIESSGNRMEGFAKILQDFNPEYLMLKVNEGEGISDSAQLKPYPVLGCIESRRRSVPNYDSVILKMFQPLLKALGGIEDKTFDEVYDEQKSVNQEKAKILGADVDKEGNNQAEIEIKTRELLEKSNANTEKSKAWAREFLKENTEYSGIKSIQEKVNVSAKELNNIQPPRVIEKIWDRIEKSDYIKIKNISLDQFFGIGKNKKFTSGNIPTYYKICVLYIMLNAIGYNTDDNLLKNKRFTTSVRDAKHVANASFAHFLLSKDKKLIKKAKAIYEYLKIGTCAELIG